MSAKPTAGDVPRFLLDTSAVLTLSGDEPGAGTVEALLIKSRRREADVYLSFISVMEAGYKAYQVRGEDGLAQLLGYLEELPVERVDVNDALIALAARMKGAYRLSVADAWILATAKQLNASLVHKDPEFEQVATAIEQWRLPYKKRARSLSDKR